MQQLPEIEQDQRLFEVVDHLNLGQLQLAEQSVLTRERLAELNLAASVKAAASAAFEPAYAYAVSGLACLEPKSWREQYTLALRLHEEAAQSAYLCGHFDHMQSIIDMALQRAATFADTLRIYEIAMFACVAQHKNLEACRLGLEVLSKFGFDFPETPTDDDIARVFGATRTFLESIAITDLANLPPMLEPTQRAAIKMLLFTSTTAYMASPNHLPLLVGKGVELTVRYGYTKETCDVYATYALILCAWAEDFELARQFADLAIQVMEQHEVMVLKAKVVYNISEFVRHWTEPHHHILAPILSVYQVGLSTGHMLYAGYGLYNGCRSHTEVTN